MCTRTHTDTHMHTHHTDIHVRMCRHMHAHTESLPRLETAQEYPPYPAIIGFPVSYYRNLKKAQGCG